MGRIAQEESPGASPERDPATSHQLVSIEASPLSSPSTESFARNESAWVHKYFWTEEDIRLKKGTGNYEHHGSVIFITGASGYTV